MNDIVSGFDSNDLDIIKWQLNSKEIHMIGIVKKCIYGYPSVILLDPVTKTEDGIRLNHMSLSNPLWLTCPYLNKKIHDLESNGYISKITEFINSDRSLIDLMKNAHAHYYSLRKNLYCKYFGEISSLEFNEKILNSGIGGIRDIDHIKCLHQHYSHYQICSDNVVGRVVHNLLNGINYCRERLCDDGSR